MTPRARFRYVEPVAEALGGSISAGVDEGGEPVYPPRSVVRKVSPQGDLGYRNTIIGIGRRYGRGRVRIIEVNGLTHIYYGEQLVRALGVDPKKRYHGLKGVPKLDSVT